MTKLTVSIMVQSLDQALAAAAQAAEQGADLVEYRLDLFAAQAALVPRLLERSPLPCILTCRPDWEGGLYTGPEQGRIDILEHAARAGRLPAYIDIELAAYQTSPTLRQVVDRIVDHPSQTLPSTTGLILSTHDFDRRPADLYRRVEAMTAAPACRVIKLAWQARSLRDNLEAFEIIRQRHKPTIALCMGEFGLPSRVLARKFGALLTFAALGTDSATAPGQPTVAQLKHLYRWDRIGPDTRVLGVIGYPVGHSMSPAVHNAGFDATGFDGVYLPLAIPPEYEHLKATLTTWIEAPQLHFSGASVTIPHKENLLRFVRERGGQIEELAQRIGAANTLTVRPDGSLYASNTDYAAALDAVCDHLHIQRAELAGRRVAVIGAGGAARAVVAGFAQYGASVVIYNRTLQRAQAIAEAFTDLPGKIIAAPLESLCKSCCQIVINCTPIGMHPNVDATPMPEGMLGNSSSDEGIASGGWGPGTVVFDTIYNPVQTRLLREAAAAGCATIPGTEMFVRQAAAQFTLWTSQAAPLEMFRKVLAQKLGMQ